ncbi:MAG: pyridoxal-phosphate dependent enzyme [Gemmatimonadetes bacterium]|nr:pyridoxal-phosphate dependent enzyme [Gemmatimonadota bacterium]NIR79644.1 pyridoxal-phosphate dependent enzyme [Gemmatimonadota bacterium]NIT88506.1 pyridoxal-phosphate dependent enzyme [Gemmatimonadota bacterium]NIU32153.1 pyridoxal-phosphate dependent enzyme [Gemmatimonadota bacterium]NIV62522.1 pyridoxal-phosphate dependent enzyme [Gemmatimonadota bacterium]
MSPRNHDALRTLDGLPRSDLAVVPTPLLEAANLTRSFSPSGPRILLKMDAWTGTGLGGNKVRKLEHVLTPPRLSGIDTVITVGGAQSNHARVTAAVAARFGLRCILVLDGDPGDPPRGNALLHRLHGAEIRRVDTRRAREAAIDEARREVEEEGGRPFVIPLGASTPEGSLGYVHAALELEEQLDAFGAWEEGPVRIVISASSSGSVAGLALGLRVLGRTDARILAVSADVGAREIRESAHRIAGGAAELLGLEDSFPDSVLEATDAFVGPGYGIATEASHAAIHHFGRLEGVVLDPTYTAKAAAGLLYRLERGRFGEEGTVVFVHTGGHPALFA